MSSAELRQALLDLDRRRAAIEAEARAIEAVGAGYRTTTECLPTPTIASPRCPSLLLLGQELESPGPNGGPAPGIRGPLVDEEGFPRSDIDVYNVRHKRHRLACLRTDHREVMAEVEAKLHELHAAGPAEPSAGPGAREHSNAEGSSTAGKAPSEQARRDAPGSPAFARIGAVVAGSPSSLAGLREGDHVIRFGEVTFENHRELQGLADFVAAHVDQEVEVEVTRSGMVVRLAVVPTRWSGRGVLGCHFLPM